jgi:protein-tyrosine-phosphatase
MNVLMVCLGNICRSPMAEFLLRDAASKKGMTLRVESAGINAEVGNPATREARQVMQERGIDAEAHVARQLTEEMLRSADLVLVATENVMRRVLMYPDADAAKIHLMLGARDLADPWGLSVTDYRETAWELDDMVERVLNLVGSSE